MKPVYNRGHQYLQVRIRYDDGSYRCRYIHHLVTEAFIGPRPAKHDVDHIDGDKTNNTVSNLRYVSRLQNMTNKNNRGKNGWQKLAARKVIAMKDGVETLYDNLKTACETLGLSLPNASCQIRGIKKNCGIRRGKPHMVTIKDVNGYTFRWAS